MPKAYFARKAPNLADVYAQLKAAKRDGSEPEPYYIAEEHVLSSQEYTRLAGSLLHDRHILAAFSSQNYEHDADGGFPCIRFQNRATGDALIIATEGYPYARYTAIESFEIDEEDDDEPEIDEETLQDALREILFCNAQPEDFGIYTTSVRTYSDAGVMTYNKGLVITLADGSEFQLTIVQSR